MAASNDNDILASTNKSDFEAAYRQHAGNFRTWLVAFGVGMPIFLASNGTIWETFSKAERASYVTCTFFAGIALQVMLAMLDKYADWFCLSTINGRRAKESYGAKFGVWWLKNDWPSILIDLASIALFGTGAYLTLRILGI